MGIAALVLGIISLIVSFIPFCGAWAIITAIIGLILGIIDWAKKSKANEPKGKAIAGTICSGLAVIIIISWFVLLGIATGTAIKNTDFNNTSINSIDWNQSFNRNIY